MPESAGTGALQYGDAATAKACVVLLHGHGMQPADLSPFAQSLGVPAMFFFPRGPCSVDGGGHAWWPARPRTDAAARDLADWDPPGRAEARAGLAAFLASLEAQRSGRPLLLGGFSQGGMLACDFALHEATPPAALALLSASRIAFDDWQPRLPRLRGRPVLVSHGRGDPDLRFEAGLALRDSLAAAGADVRWHPFEGGHQIPLPVWRALRKLIGELAAGPIRSAADSP